MNNNAPPSLWKKYGQQLLNRGDEMRCYWCGNSVTDEVTYKDEDWINRRAVIDHLIPKSKNGTDDLDNLVICCWKCNSIKGTGIDVFYDNEILIEDEAEVRDFYMQIPNLVDDTSMSVYAFRLYCHLKRVVGANGNGKCWASTQTLAKDCNMSVGMISKAKKELEALKFIIINQVPHAGRAAHNIRIVNIWKKNHYAYVQSSPDELQHSPDELQHSPGELKNNNIRINGKNKSDANASDAGKLPLSSGLKFFLQSFNAVRFKNTIQRDTMQALEKKYGTSKLKEYTLWAARNGFTVSKAVASAEKALENWGKAKIKKGNKDDPSRYIGGAFAEFIEH